MKKFIDAMKMGLVGLFYMGLFIYGVMLLLYVFKVQPVVDLLAKTPVYTFGLPICGITAFVIVCVLEQLATDIQDGDSKLKFKAFGLEFSGPAGPVTLWVVCYLVPVASIRIVGGAK